MKRSEMINLIDQCVYDYTDDDFMLENPSKFAYELLNIIEEAGMLPPIRHNIAQGSDEAIMGLKWEPEDE